MKKIRLDLTCAGLFALMLCGPGVAAASEAVTASPVVITGTDNTSAEGGLDTRGLTIKLEKDALLDVTEGNAALRLGEGGSVTLESGAQIYLKREAANAEALTGILMDGHWENSDNRVDLGKGASVVVESAGAGDTTGIDIQHADSAHVTMAGARLEASTTKGDVYGLHLGDVTLPNTAELAMSDGASLVVKGQALQVKGAVSYEEGEAIGVLIETTAHGVVSLAGGSTIDVTKEVSGDKAEISALGVLIYTAEEAEVALDGESHIHATAKSQGAAGEALAIGVLLEDIESPDTASLMVGNGSSVNAEAEGTEASAGAAIIRYSRHGVVKAAGEKCFTAKATAHAAEVAFKTTDSTPEGSAIASATVLGMENVNWVDIDLTDATLTGTMTATADQSTGDAIAVVGKSDEGVVPVGIGAVRYTNADIRLTDTTVTVTAEATAKAPNGDSAARVGGVSEKISMVSGLLVAPQGVDRVTLVDSGMSMDRLRVGDRTAITLDGTTIKVTGKATAARTSFSAVSGIQLKGLSGENDWDPATLQLTDSTIQAFSTSTGEQTKAALIEGSIAVSMGIAVSDLYGKATFAFDNTRVLATAEAERAVAIGICGIENHGPLVISLANGSVVKAVGVSSKGEVDAREMEPSSAAILLERGEITIDETSSVVGAWAVKGTESDDYSMVFSDGETRSQVSVNNQGLLSGRLSRVALTNAATGTLQATFGSKDGFGYSAEAEADNTFYFETDSALLADGTTFKIVPSDDLGLAKAGDSKEYGLLQSGSNVSENQAALTLVIEGNSPLLGLNWVDTPSDNELVARVSFLSPVEAGISGNAGQALNAALNDMPDSFVFGTDPEAWMPKVSGAFLTGMAHTLVASQSNIGNRLGGLMGLNSGDEIAAAGGLWYNASFTDADQGKRDGVVGFDADTTGLSLGCDRQVGSLTLGVAFTQGKTNADADDGSSEMDMDDTLFSLYSSVDGGKWFGEAVLSAGFGNVDSARRLGDKVFTADYDSTSYNAMVNLGMKLSSAGWQVTPRLVVDYSVKDYDSYTETGGKDSGALEVDSQDYTVLNIGGGATVQRSWVKSWGVLTPEASAMMRYDLEGDRVVTTARFVGGNMGFVAHGADPAETSWELSTAFTLASVEESAVSLRLGFDYAGREDFNAHSVSGKVRFEF
ncbi:autotransporter outer membrane beta-barrel domain-containing protein [Desulfoluna sp.]|uniref:autotransporter family protein n=1 Tax=Desulfoluna sp. TaxID=2045199 RepID=UPI002605D10E|nr:autotransporter outer membrane beta-barrel domain-containing protein [Desulfoluna sp.]